MWLRLQRRSASVSPRASPFSTKLSGEVKRHRMNSGAMGAAAGRRVAASCRKVMCVVDQQVGDKLTLYRPAVAQQVRRTRCFAAPLECSAVNSSGDDYLPFVLSQGCLSRRTTAHSLARRLRPHRHRDRLVPPSNREKLRCESDQVGHVRARCDRINDEMVTVCSFCRWSEREESAPANQISQCRNPMLSPSSRNTAFRRCCCIDDSPALTSGQNVPAPVTFSRAAPVSPHVAPPHCHIIMRPLLKRRTDGLSQLQGAACPDTQ